MRYVPLHYPLDAATPVYGDNPRPEVRYLSRIGAGAPGNASVVSLHSHTGTHVDAPRHFRDDGLTMADFTPGFWTFGRVGLIDVPAGRDRLVTPEDLRPHAAAIGQCDLLLIRTGHGKCRSIDPDVYRLHGPGISPEAARELRKYPGLRAVGVDTISVTAYQDRPRGREAHRAFFGRAYPAEFVLIEDMRLDGIGRPDTVVVEPFFRMMLEASPAIVLAYYDIAGMVDFDPGQ